jgi:cellulose synthase/poly-beta-1,6-N-acetylglucosamine synthase-like glycosyltransferase
MNRVDVLIPTHDDGEMIGRTLDSILTQDYSEAYGYDVTVIANGCTDDTAQHAEEYEQAFAAHDLLSLKVIETPQTGKITAINLGLAATEREIVLSVDGDVTFSPTCFDRILDKMQDPTVIVSGAVPRIQVPECNKGTFLGELQTTGEIAWAARQNDTIPFGDAMAFKRRNVPVFHSQANVDDTWLGLSVSHNYGLEAVQIEQEAFAYSFFPTTWSAWLTQRTRWASNNQRVVDRFPEFSHVLQERRQHSPDFAEVDKRALATMEQQGIPAERLLQYRTFARMCAENAILMRSRLDQEGDSWERVT